MGTEGSTQIPVYCSPYIRCEIGNKEWKFHQKLNILQKFQRKFFIAIQWKTEKFSLFMWTFLIERNYAT